MRCKGFRVLFGISIVTFLLVMGSGIGSGGSIYAGSKEQKKITFPNLISPYYTLKKGEVKQIPVRYNGKVVKPGNLVWQSKNDSIVKVGKQGRLKGVKEGTTSVIVHIKKKKSIRATIKIRIGKPVDTLTVNKKTVIMKRGMTYGLKAGVRPKDADNAKIGFLSRKPSIVQVNGKGRLKAKKAGTTTVYVYSKDGRKRVGVKVRVQEDCAQYTIKKGKSKKIGDVLSNNVETKDVNASKYIWKSRNNKVVKVVGNSTLKAVKKGTAYIEGTTKNGRQMGVLLKITVGTPSKSVKVAFDSYIMDIGGTISLKAKVNPTSATNKGLVYISEDPKVASVSRKGKVSGVSPGKTKIMVYARDGCSKSSFTVIVRAPLRRKTTYGVIEGDLKTNGTPAVAWLGVPYAKPPVGELRWKAPRDCDPWNGVLKTKEYKDMAAQIGADNLKGSEDCLYLNIYRPNTDEKNLPVMVFLHGGGNVTGNSRRNFKNLCNVSNSIIVSVEYRLGAFGWMNLTALNTGDKEQDSGNFALLDIKKSLEWIRDNITEFGGDKNNVTLTGFSAGARNVLACLISPIMDGLYHKLISFSGGMTTAPPEQGWDVTNSRLANILVNKGKFKQRKDALNWLENTATNDEIKEFLYGLTTYEVANIYKHMGLRMNNAPQLFTDGYVLPKDGFESLKKGNYNKVPIILGSSSHEFSVYALTANYTQEGADVQVLRTGWNMMEMILAANEYGSLLQTGWCIERNAEGLFANANPNVYAYRFDWGNDAKVTGDFYSKFIGSKHGAEMPFFTGYWSNSHQDYAPDALNDANYPGRKELSGNMQQYIGNFLRTGNPNGTGLKNWGKWNSASGKERVMAFNANNNNDTSKMSSEYIKEADVYAKMKKNLTEAQYDMLVNFVFKGKAFMPAEAYKRSSEDVDDGNGDLNEEIYDDVES